jgi:hypothetical protein
MGGFAMSLEPYTHAAHSKRVHEAALNRVVLSNQLIQVKKGQVVYCAILKAPYTVPDGPDCWTVETVWPDAGKFTTVCKNVRLCGDEKCSCAAERQAERERFSAALAGCSEPESM